MLFVQACAFCSIVWFLLAAVRIQTFLDVQSHRMQIRGYSNRRREIIFSFTTGSGREIIHSEKKAGPHDQQVQVKGLHQKRPAYASQLKRFANLSNDPSC